MSSFTTPPIVTLTDTGKIFIVYEEFRYYVGDEDSNDFLIIPAGFRTNLANIVRIGRHWKAAVVHDYLYGTQARSRKEADDIFLEAMRVSGVNWFTRHTMYQAVRVGGWVIWNRIKKRRLKELNRA